MPRRSRAPGRRRRAPKAAPSAFDIADAMEMPLHRVEDLVRTLEFVGYGLASLEDDGAPAVMGIAQALAQNVAAVKESWLLLFRRSAITDRESDS